jgi:hypothetical protein
MPTKTAPTKAAAPAKAPSKSPSKGSVKSKDVAPAKPPSGTEAAAETAVETAPAAETSAEAGLEAGTATAAAAEAGAGAASQVALTPAVVALLADPAAPSLVGQQCEMLTDSRPQIASQAANVIAQVFATRPELVVPHVSKLSKAIVTKNKRVVQVCADAMPSIAKVAPARVARELDFLRNGFANSLEEGQDGLVRTFATLCIASVAYQKRLEPVLTEALSIAEGKTLLRWTQAILPSLKGEPHARARAVVEGRLDALARPVSQPIADFLGIKLRPRPR